jgi:hypothetical protein
MLDLSPWMFLEVVKRIPFSEWDSDELNIEVKESEEGFDFGTGGDWVDRGVELE